LADISCPAPGIVLPLVRHPKERSEVDPKGPNAGWVVPFWGKEPAPVRMCLFPIKRVPVFLWCTFVRCGSL
jgi:hypothetical protein